MELPKHIKNRYYSWQLDRWLQFRKNEEQLYEDSRGNIWKLNEVFESNSNHYALYVLIDTLWELHREERVWGLFLPTIGQAYIDIITGLYLHRSVPSLIRSADLSGSWEDHLCRIALFAFSIKIKRTLPALTIGPSQQLWDGYHRLIAYKLCGQQTVEAVQLDISTIVT